MVGTIRIFALFAFLWPLLCLSEGLDLSAFPLNTVSIHARSVAEADEAIRAQVSEIRRQNFKIEKVMVTHVGKLNARVQAMLGVLKAKHIPFEWRHVDENDDIAKIAAERINRQWGARQFEVLHSGQNLEDIQKPSLGVFQSIGAQTRHFFGVPNGITWTTFLVTRTTWEKIGAAAFAVTKAAILAAFTYYTLDMQAADGMDIGVWVPTLVGSLWSMFFDYFNVNNQAFSTQGYYYDFKEKEFRTATSFAIAKQFTDSTCVRQSIKLSAHMTGKSFDWSNLPTYIMEAMTTTTMGVFSRVPINLNIKKFTADPSRKWMEKYLLATSSTLFGFLQILDMFKVGKTFRYILAGLGATGLSIELYKARDNIYYWFKDYYDQLFPSKDECYTALQYQYQPVSAAVPAYN
ncbi:MAG: hypothetical protein AB7F43_12935 [Bacteriovoracia bacterium]